MDNLRSDVNALEGKMQMITHLLKHAQFQVPTEIKETRDLLDTALEVEAAHLVEQCGEKLASTIKDENVIEFYQFAVEKNIENLANAARLHILSNFMSIYKSEEFKKLSFDRLSGFLRSDDLNVKEEECVFEAIVLWVRKDKNKRKYVMKDIDQYVRFKCCDVRFLKGLQEHYLLWDNADFQKELQNLIKAKELNSEDFQEKVKDEKRTCLK